MLRRVALLLAVVGAASGCGRTPAPPVTAPDPTVGRVQAPSGTSWGEIVYRVESLTMAHVPRFELIVDGEPGRRTTPIEVPHGSEVPSVVLSVDVSAIGAIVAVNSKPATAETYRTELASWLGPVSPGSRKVVIRADRRTPFGNVVDVAKAAQDLGGVVLFGVAPSLAAKARAKDLDWTKCAPPQSVYDAAKAESLTVALTVHVDSEGHARSVDLVEGDPLGFGGVAQACALRADYEPARAADGRAIAGDVALRVRFDP